MRFILVILSSVIQLESEPKCQSSGTLIRVTQAFTWNANKKLVKQVCRCSRFNTKVNTTRQSSLQCHHRTIVSLRNRKADGRGQQTFMCDRRDKAIACVCCRDFSIILLCFISLQKHLFKGRWSFFQHNHCHACHTVKLFFYLSFAVLLRKFTSKIGQTNVCCRNWSD